MFRQYINKNHVEAEIDILEDIIIINRVSVEHGYRGTGLFKTFLNNLQNKLKKDIELECFFTLVPMYVHLGFENLGESDADGYHLMKRRYDYNTDK